MERLTEEEKDNLMSSFLVQAIEEKNLTNVKLYVDLGSPLDRLVVLNGISDTPLNHAVNYGSMEIFRYLLLNGADPNSAMRNVSVKGDLDRLKVLIDHGADINRPTSDFSLTPLQLAACHGHADVAQYMIENGADIYAKSLGGKTLIERVRSEGHHAIADFMVSFVEQRQLDGAINQASQGQHNSMQF